jgi:hypothetical protein
MNTLLPPEPLSKRRSSTVIIAVCLALLVVVASGLLAIRSIVKTGITKVPDDLFGDQHLKTAVALIELHKVRYGKYPDSLSNLRYIGQWDPIALQSVRYYPNADRTKYYIEVERGWIGKPELKMPDEFWQGTGYTTTLKPPN